ncbi:hypothetical protein N7530_007138 [Penicillium desertorum]|uniref:Dehydrogenase E1 component domain-containing protein n=1 Tax=Penicillium desertorum TaxID=1303715 RepID=A0A9W9WLS3_9EURO|nr:hypothetical protein N7530_007138 [Penicillium desertorum]
MPATIRAKFLPFGARRPTFIRSLYVEQLGIEYVISKEDKLITIYRSYRFIYIRGGIIRLIIGELLGRRDSIVYRKGGSMYIYSKSFFSGNSIVGANILLGAGIAFS